jgi:hypothetical protein
VAAALEGGGAGAGGRGVTVDGVGVAIVLLGDVAGGRLWQAEAANAIRRSAQHDLTIDINTSG